MTPSDYTAAIESAAFFDDSAMGKIILRGPDARKFLGNLSTNDIAKLPIGVGCPTYFCDSRAKALFQTTVYPIPHADGETLWLEVTPGRDVALFQHLDRYLISEAVELENATERFAQFHLAGPKASEILESAHAVDLPGASTVLRKRDRLGLPGHDIVCAKERSEEIAQMLLAAGAIPGTPETREILRIEAGAAEYGKDFDESRFVMEIAGADRAVSYSKGCYLGQEPIVMSRDRAGHAPRSMVKLRGQSPLAAGAKLFSGADEVGWVTSATESPRFGPIALGYVKWKHREPGTMLEADVSGERAKVAVQP